jgi:hypothetical protein
MEEQLRGKNKTPQQCTIDELESLWQKAKQHETGPFPSSK